MSAVEKIKAAAAELGPDEQYELFRWWTGSDAFRQRQLAALKGEITRGIEDLDGGRYQTYSEANIMQLAEDVGRGGRERLKKRGVVFNRFRPSTRCDWSCGHSRAPSPGPSVAGGRYGLNPVEVGFGSQIERLAVRCGASHESGIQFVCRQYFEGAAGLEHRGRAVLAEEI